MTQKAQSKEKYQNAFPDKHYTRMKCTQTYEMILMCISIFYFKKNIIERLLTFGSTKLLLNHVLQLPLITVVAPKLLESFKSAQILELHQQLRPGNNHKTVL